MRSHPSISPRAFEAKSTIWTLIFKKGIPSGPASRSGMGSSSKTIADRST